MRVASAKGVFDGVLELVHNVGWAGHEASDEMQARAGLLALISCFNIIIFIVDDIRGLVYRGVREVISLI